MINLLNPIKIRRHNKFSWKIWRRYTRHNAIPIGVLIGVTALIPIVGAFIGVIIGAILIVSINPIKVITFVVFVLILQQIEGNLIYPRVVGNSIGLPGMWVLVAVSLGGSIGGILGMLLYLSHNN